jgi:CheY-like chemotaxis protein
VQVNSLGLGLPTVRGASCSALRECSMDRILLLQGETNARNATVQVLRQEQRWDVCAVGTAREAGAALDRQPFQMVVAELTLADRPAVELLQRLRQAETSIPFLAITACYDELVRQYPDVSTWDVLRRPIEEGQLLGRLRQKLADKKLSSPPDSAFTVADYLQLAGMARRSVIIHVESSNVEGQIVVQNGAPVWARDREGLGTDAFQRLALLPRADINCQPCTTWSTKANLEGSLEQLLLDAARRSDEVVRAASRSRAVAVAAQAPAAAPSSPMASAPPPPPNRVIPRPNLPPPRRERSDGPAPALEVSVHKAPVARTATPLPAVVDAPPPASASTDNLRQVATASAPQSKPITSLQHKETGMSSDTSRPPDSQRILTGVPAINAIARADKEGSVLDYAGAFDAETACAVATIASRPITEIVGELGLGDLQSWCVSMGENTWYVVHQSRQLYVAQGTASKNPTNVLRKVEAGCRGQQ